MRYPEPLFQTRNFASLHSGKFHVWDILGNFPSLHSGKFHVWDILGNFTSGTFWEISRLGHSFAEMSITYYLRISAIPVWQNEPSV